QFALVLVLGAEIHRQGGLGDHALVQLRRRLLAGVLLLDRKEVNRDILEYGLGVRAAQFPLDRDTVAGFDLQDRALRRLGIAGRRLGVRGLARLAGANVEVDGEWLTGSGGGNEQSAERSQREETTTHGAGLSGRRWEGTAVGKRLRPSSWDVAAPCAREKAPSRHNAVK